MGQQDLAQTLCRLRIRHLDLEDVVDHPDRVGRHAHALIPLFRAVGEGEASEMPRTRDAVALHQAVTEYLTSMRTDVGDGPPGRVPIGQQHRVTADQARIGRVCGEF